MGVLGCREGIFAGQQSELAELVDELYVSREKISTLEVMWSSVTAELRADEAVLIKMKSQPQDLTILLDLAYVMRSETSEGVPSVDVPQCRFHVLPADIAHQALESQPFAEAQVAKPLRIGCYIPKQE